MVRLEELGRAPVRAVFWYVVVACRPPHCSEASPAQGTLASLAQVLETVVAFVMVLPQ